MNGEPHTHNVQIKRMYESIDSGDYVVTYGDTQVFVDTYNPHLFSLERRLKRAVRKAIRRHDHGSVTAAHRQVNIAKLLEEVNDLPEGRWASGMRHNDGSQP